MKVSAGIVLLSILGAALMTSPLAAQSDPAEPSPGEVTGDAKAGMVGSMIGSSGSSHSESSSSSSSSSITMSVPSAGNIGTGPMMSGLPSFNVGAFAGTWTLNLAGVTCTIEMQNSRSGGRYNSSPSNQCAPGAEKVAYWQPTGNGVRLTDQTGKTLGALYPYGPHRWKGKVGGDNAVLTR